MSGDVHIRDDIQREFYYSPRLNGAAIGVAVQDGIVTLTGTVDTHAQKLEALRAAERIAGVKAVANRMDVRLPGPSDPTDTGLARAAANVLAWNTAVPPDRVRIGVEGGWITLEGMLDWQYQRDAAGSAVAALTGVKGVENRISVNSGVSAEDTKARIEAALKLSPSIEDRNILVEVNHDKVVLHGEVRSIPEREEAERIAWTAPGVSDVSNHILVAQPAGI
jgi:osmotically-inducible protein OsmY